jgi:hypothetical protein
MCTAEVEIMGERGNVRSQKVLANSQFPESFAVKFSILPNPTNTPEIILYVMSAMKMLTVYIILTKFINNPR